MEVSKESQIIKSYFDNEKFNHQSKHILLELYKCDFDKLNEIMNSLFNAPYPARAAVEVSRLPKDALIEIDAIVASQ